MGKIFRKEQVLKQEIQPNVFWGTETGPMKQGSDNSERDKQMSFKGNMEI